MNTSFKRMMLQRLYLLLQTERLYPLIAMVIASVALFLNQGGCTFLEWSAFVGGSVLVGSGGALLKKKFVDTDSTITKQ